MNIKSINSANSNPNFGLKLSQNAAYSIIEDFKNEGASDNECAYYLKTIMNSAPDTFELIEYKIKPEWHCCWDGDRLDLVSSVRIKDNNKTVNYADSQSRSYYYEGTEENPECYTKAETKVFLCEDLLATIKNAIEKFPNLEDINASYGSIIKKAQSFKR